MKQEEILLLENQLCFSIYACSREIVRLYRPYLDELGITYPQYLVLLVLWEHETCSVNELGENLFLDSGTLTPMLKRMETTGLLIRKRSIEDERKVLISLTQMGLELKEKAFCIPTSLFEGTETTEEEFLQLLKQNKSLLQKIQKINQGRD
jgi:DNA-binding MarR family transcriptional regulator